MTLQELQEQACQLSASVWLRHAFGKRLALVNVIVRSIQDHPTQDW